ncbi:hypothetical protein EZV62_008459 [Acer yangbiense]|uniref:Non-specific serine/threonine protein kinase n=1 Tax=Acer yangbiense TaxID=1000413 RepID=A0A5C7IDP0_9ROSI|nr:hypothetical protein EZV62_008459 [Acer yangbiense]
MRIATATLDTITLGQSIRDGETLVSADQRFELGFFSPGTSRSRYLGIWYKKVAPKTTAWVANRDTPISDPSGILNINAGGILVLLNSTNDTVWSSNASRTPQNPVAVLLGSGNLVVKDGNDNNPDNFLWQSFDYPGDTLLPGMKLGINLVTGLEWFYTSWKSTDDPSQGEFTAIIDPHGFPQLFLKKGPVILYRPGSWNGLRFTGSAQSKQSSMFLYNFVSNEKEVFFKYDVQDSSVLSRVVLTPSGVVQRFTGIDKTTRTWLEYNSGNNDECDNYAKCGAHAICNMNNFPTCTCFDKFKPKSQLQWSIYNWSAGCVRKAPLDCKHEDGFLKIEAIKLPETSHSRTEKYISLVECKKSCLSNCSCTAYATLDIREGGSGCLLWFNDLIDIKYIEGGQDLYVRIAASELGNIESRRQPSGKKHVNVIIIVASTISGMGALVLAWIMYMRKTKLKNKDDILSSIKSILMHFLPNASMRESMKFFRLLILYCFLFSSTRIASTTTQDTITLGQSIRDGETLVSADERFELGFFSPGTSSSPYLGIWYKKVAPKTTVWVANRDTPISDPSGILNINAGGILVLLNSTNDTVWSSNASRTPQSPVAVLLGSGNLVVKDGNDNNPDNFLWQSFDYPGDTLLPDMKLGINLVTGLEWFYTSWKSTDDPSQGEFTAIIDPHGSPQLFFKMGPVIVYRSGSWNGVDWTGSPQLKPNPYSTYNFVSNEEELNDCDVFL